jgi:hypothetical protein
MTEQWKDIKGFEGIYKVSSLGNFRRVVLKKGNLIERPVKTIQSKKTGYVKINLHKGGKRKHCLVHRVVAETFLTDSKVSELDHVHHKNFIRNDNKLDNLMWSTPVFNLTHKEPDEDKMRVLVRSIISIMNEMGLVKSEA